MLLVINEMFMFLGGFFNDWLKREFGKCCNEVYVWWGLDVGDSSIYVWG